MFDYGPYKCWWHIRKLYDQVALLLALVGSINTRIRTGSASPVYIIIRDAPVNRATFPADEPPPADPSFAAIVIYRDHTPSITWDPDNQAWIS